MKVRFLDTATAELEEAAAYYGEVEFNQGHGLVEEVFRTVEFIRAYPHAGSAMSRYTRRWLTRRFPYGVLYEVSDDEILIVGIMHLSRDPESWKSRLR